MTFEHQPFTTNQNTFRTKDELAEYLTKKLNGGELPNPTKKAIDHNRAVAKMVKILGNRQVNILKV